MKVSLCSPGVLILCLCVFGLMSARCPGAERLWQATADGQSAGSDGAAVVINELMASNGRTVADPQGQYDDWLELHSVADTPVDVGGMYLTDDPSSPMKWQIPAADPASTTIPAGGYLLIWADGDVADAGLHANFKLSASGEDIALYDRDGQTLIDSVSFGAQVTDISYGRLPESNDTWSAMTFPTPGNPNVRLYQGFVQKPRFSPERGFYDDGVMVTITCKTPGATIYYTVDGSNPYAAERVAPATHAGVYEGPILIDKTTCLRAVAVQYGWMASPVETNTYLFVQDVVTQSPNGERPGNAWPSSSVNGQMINYGMDPDVVNDPAYQDVIEDALLSIPSISLATDVANLFDPKTGIYVNARSQGTNWQRPVSVELICADDTEGFQIDAGLRIRGGYSRSGGNPKHAFRLFFDPQYGTPRLTYPLFGDEGVDTFENIDLRTSQNYSWSYEGGNSNSRDTFVREVFSRDTQRDMGQSYTRSRYYHLYIDGHYWGLYQTQERPEASYAESYYDGAKDDYDVVKSRGGNGGYDIEATDGTLDAWRRLWDAGRSGFDNDETYYRVQGLNPDGTPNPEYEKLLDIDNLIDYMLCTYYVGDPDGPVSAWALVANNFYGVYNRAAPDGFKFFRHDAEHSLYGLNESRLFAPTTTAVGDRFNQSNPLWMHTHLITHPEYRMRFADRVYKTFFNEGELTPQRCIDRFMARAGEIDLAIVAESARWGDAKRSRPRTRDEDWRPDIDGMVNSYFPSRTGVVLNQFKSQGWYPSVSPPSFNQQGGYIPEGFALEMNGSGIIYYTLDGSDPRLPGRGGSAAGTRTLVAENAAKRVLIPAGEIDDAWKGGQGFDDSAWQGGTGGVGYERSTGYEPYFDIDVRNSMYGVNTSCYIRIPFDLTDDDIDGLSNLAMKIRYDDGFIAYLNGVEVLRVQFEGDPSWQASATANHSDLDAINFETFNISSSLDALGPGRNILAIHGVNASSTSSDFLISTELFSGQGAGAGVASGVSPTAVRYAGPVALDATTQVKARVLGGNTWSALQEAVFAVGPVAASLRISEIMYHPAETGDPGDPNTEYIELTNVAAAAVNLNLVRFVEGIDFTFPSVDLGPGDTVLVVRDVVAFEARYGAGFNIAGQYAGSLNNGGERIELQDATGRTLYRFRFRDNWYDITDGLGFSLTVKDPAVTDPAALDSKTAWRPSAVAGGSPGFDDTGEIPELGAVVINELLANSEAGAPDWIELHNTTDRPIDIGGWFLSDDAQDLMKYEIAEGTTIPAGGYLVFFEDLHFGNPDDPGHRTAFALSRNGETVHFHSGSDGVLTGYSEEERFGASETGVSLGRYRKSTGTYNFVALSEPTPGWSNAGPQVGPVVINEVMYHPAGPAPAEYVELLNISDAAVTFYDAARGAAWRFTDDPENPEIDLVFPSDEPVTLAPGGYLVLVQNLASFKARYTVPGDVQVLEWGPGRLSDAGEKVQLSRPGDEAGDGARCWIRADRLVYSDGTHPEDFADGRDPWPVEADGQGASLSRIVPGDYGNDPINWHAVLASPGRINN